MRSSRHELSILALALLLSLGARTVIAARPAKLLFVASTIPPEGSDSLRNEAFAAWGFEVALATADQTREQLLSAAADVDVCFISSECNDLEIADKLKSSPVGIVTDHYALADDFAVTKSISAARRTRMRMVAPFRAGPPVGSGACTFMLPAPLPTHAARSP